MMDIENLSYINRIKKELLSKHGVDNVYYIFLDNIELFKSVECKCIKCNKKSYHLYEGKDIVCSECGFKIGYRDELLYDNVIKYSLDHLDDEQKKIINKNINGVEYDYVISLLNEIIDLDKNQKKKFFELIK